MFEALQGFVAASPDPEDEPGGPAPSGPPVQAIPAGLTPW
jgi:hypothetical protein